LWQQEEIEEKSFVARGGPLDDGQVRVGADCGMLRQSRMNWVARVAA
jgi:hypothetical protein